MTNKIPNPTGERRLRQLFDASIIIKGLDGLLQVAAGVLLLFVKPQSLNRALIALTEHELLQDPKDKIANYILSLGHLSAGSKLFGILFLLSHGLIKIFIVIGLLKNKLWFYPLGIVVFTAFGLYQIYQYSHTHSLGLLILTILDVFVVALTWHEYRVIKHHLI